jgi:Raf kinase inhibitor-like YbhB/YbcL family protein
MALLISSPAFDDGAEIPAVYTCEGKDISPPLEWKNVPDGTKSLVLIVDDPDAPDPKAPQRTWVHWVVVDLPPEAPGIREGAKGASLPEGAVEGENDWKRRGYGGPCPPIGRHRYFHKLYALDLKLAGMRSMTKAAVEAAMKGHVIERAELMGTYQKHGR